MKRIITGLALLAASQLFAQQPGAAPEASAAETIVAKVNGEVITKARLDHLWNRMGERGRQQYEKSGGGKAGFLDSYVRKRLLLQQVMASGFDQKPEVQAELEAAKESALFDTYVREVVATQVVPETELRKFYDENLEQFTRGERRYLRYLLIGTKNRSVEQARTILAPIMAELHGKYVETMRSGAGPEAFGRIFSEAARKYSEDPSAAMGGEIGWTEAATLEPQVAEAAFGVKAGAMSGMIATDSGLHLFYIQGVRPPETESYDQVRRGIREYFLSTNAARILEAVNKATTGALASGKVELFMENVK